MGDFYKGFKKREPMKLLASLVVAAYGQNYDYDFYSSGEAYRFGSVGAGSQFSTSETVQADGWSPPIDSGTDDANDNSQGAHLMTGGIYDDAIRYKSFGHGGNRRYCHTTRNNRAVYNWTSHAYGGYFAEGRNFMECMGEELYCFIEERAHYGQIIGITAGCEQMMNHPSVTIQDQQALISDSYTQINAIKNNYNQEAARGGANRHGFFTYYGLGGCLAMPAQNGHHMIAPRQRGPATTLGGTAQTSQRYHPNGYRVGVDSDSWRAYKWTNYYRNFHGGYGQNQCLRFPKQRLKSDPASSSDIVDPTSLSSCGTTDDVDDDITGTPNTTDNNTTDGTSTSQSSCFERVSSNKIYNSPGQLLPFGVSVCRACCVAEFAQEDAFTSSGVVSGSYATMLCNYPPDTDANIEKQTNEQFEELIPRFDMAGAAFNAFQTPNQNDKQLMADRDNNLFVHGSWCSEAGPGRGCARIPDSASWGSTDTNYVYGSDLSTLATPVGASLNWIYSCVQDPKQGRANTAYFGMLPIGAQENRDWCPGRPWLAKTHDDERHTKPLPSNTSVSASNANPSFSNIVG